jgi:hypothetical protein
VRADRLNASLEVPFKHNRCDSRQCVQGPFKAYQPALATTILNGHYKSKESEKEIIYQELRIGRKENAKRRLRPCCLRRSLRFALKVGQFVVSCVSKRLYEARSRYGIVCSNVERDKGCFYLSLVQYRLRALSRRVILVLDNRIYNTYLRYVFV